MAFQGIFDSLMRLLGGKPKSSPAGKAQPGRTTRTVGEVFSADRQRKAVILQKGELFIVEQYAWTDDNNYFFWKPLNISSMTNTLDDAYRLANETVE